MDDLGNMDGNRTLRDDGTANFVVDRPKKVPGTLN